MARGAGRLIAVALAGLAGTGAGLAQQAAWWNTPAWYGRDKPLVDAQDVHYEGADRLAIVPIDGRGAFFTTELHFNNYHHCRLQGLARAEGDQLVFRDRRRLGDRTCVLHLRREDADIALDDEGGSCEAYCGARGSFRGVSVPLSPRHPIAVTDEARADPAYRAAVAELEATAR